MTFEKQNPERKREQKRYMEASNSVVKEVKNKTKQKALKLKSSKL